MHDMLPLGLCSAPLIFTVIADALEWIIRQQGVNGIDHYIDDFVITGPPKSDVCVHALGPDNWSVAIDSRQAHPPAKGSIAVVLSESLQEM